MCLATNDSTIHVADKDIFVYKKLFYLPDKFLKSIFNPSKPVSLVEDYPYEKGKIQPKVNLISIKDTSDDVFHVYEGYHSDVERQENSNALFLIPKGTKYIKGWFNCEKNRPNYVSETIIYLRKL